VTYFSKLKMACTEFSNDNNFYIKRWNLIVLFHFENRQVFLPHSVCRKHNIEIASPASSRDQGKYMKYFGFTWPPLEAALSGFNICLVC